MANNNTKKITVVGGGSSGWLVASGLIRYYPDREIVVIDSSKIPAIGVGESTTAMMRQYIVGSLKIDEKEFCKGTDAIWKSNVRFRDFAKIGSQFDYPIGSPFTETKTSTLGMSVWNLKKMFYPETSDSDFIESYFPHYQLYNQQKVTTRTDMLGFRPTVDYAYHLDANKLGPWLRDNYCTPKGVTHIDSEIKDVKVGQDGIEYLVLEDGSHHESDIYIDCTGFRSKLLGQAMEEEWVSLESLLHNNRAWATPIPYTDPYKEMQPFTTATALKNGWAWYTPIWSRIGNGYSYSNKYISEEDALKEFKEYLMSDKMPIPRTKDQVEDQPYLNLSMKAGYYKRSWVKNVVAIGLSSGFLEPLEGTGLMFVHDIFLSLCKFLDYDKVNQFQRDIFNKKVEEEYLGWRDILSLFYVESKRDDSDYWKDLTSISVTELNKFSGRWTNQNLYRFADAILIDNLNEKTNPMEAALYITMGMNFNHDMGYHVYDRWNTWEDQFDWKPTVDLWQKEREEIIKAWKNFAKEQPHVYDFFKEEVWGDK